MSFHAIIKPPKIVLLKLFLHFSFVQFQLFCLLIFPLLKSLLHARGDCSQVAVDLGRRLSENQAHDGLTGHVDVLVGAEDVDLAVGQDDTGLAGVLDGDCVCC